MAHLASIENDFQNFLLTGRGEIAQSVVGTQRVPVATRLAIYGNAYRSRLIETLEAHYPALLALIGAEEFAALGSDYVHAHDSSYASVRFYGGELGAFLTSHPDCAARPWLAELARFEWAMADVFDALDATPIAVQALAQIAPENWAALGFELHPALRQLELLWQVPALWSALTSARPPPAPEAEGHPVRWLLWRRDLQIFYRPLTALEAEALAIVRAGGSFGALCSALCSALDEVQAPARAAAYLREWVESGMIVGMRAGEE